MSTIALITQIIGLLSKTVSKETLQLAVTFFTLIAKRAPVADIFTAFLAVVKSIFPTPEPTPGPTPVFATAEGEAEHCVAQAVNAGIKDADMRELVNALK